MAMFLYINGDFIDQKKAVISPLDHGYLYGLGVFETLRTYRGVPFLLEEHIYRLNAGLKEMGINQTLQTDAVSKIIRELSVLNGLKDSYIRINVSAGVGNIGLQTDTYTDPTFILFQKELPDADQLREKEAVILTLRRNTPESGFRLKSHHFFNNAAAKREIGPGAEKEGIFLSQDGYLAEGITSNLFWVNGGVLYTPSLETGILNGITRQFVMRLASETGIPIKEGVYRKSVLNEAEEIFFTNSIQEISPVRTFHGRRLPGKKGSFTQVLNKLYQEFICSVVSQ
ncbi:aminodeoxychorismate lyase [Siminovitchia sediminis]|uniref:Aminodeoxychorismate lyase n=1 Tax=Siminovitchia sediminis TaxID=1274353 RepID=A0ABW4KLZ5_9BACI